MRTSALRDHTSGRLLNGHVFDTIAEGRKWMAQGWNPAKSGFVLWEVDATDAPCPSCGRPVGLRATKWLTILISESTAATPEGK